MTVNVFPKYYSADGGSQHHLATLLVKRMGTAEQQETGYLKHGKADLVILSPSKVKITVKVHPADLATYGGTGGVLAEEEFTLFGGEEKEVLDRTLLNLYNRATENVLERMEYEERQARFTALRKSMFGV